MSGNNNSATIAADRHLHSVDNAQEKQSSPTTADKVRAALADAPGSATAELALTAGVGRSTAAKILAQWGLEGSVIRTPGDGPRKPDTWALAPSENDIAAPDTDNAPSYATTTPNSDEPTDNTSHTFEDSTAEETAATEKMIADADISAAEDTTAVEGPRAASENDDVKTATDTPDDTSAPPAYGATPPPAEPRDPVDSGTETQARLSAALPAVAEPADTAPTDKNRLSKGALRALVEEYLTKHRGESFGPAKIGQELSRSAGAVNNALEKLVADGYAIKTCEAPKRFAINPGKTDVDTPTAADASTE